jgi:sortase A
MAASTEPAGPRRRILGSDTRLIPVFHWIEGCLLVLGAVCLVWAGFVTAEARRYQRDEKAALQQLLMAVPPVSAPATSVPLHTGDLIGSLTILRLHLSAVVVEGDDDGALNVAIGHLPDTRQPWDRGNGNVALAAHRDTFFRPLKDVVVGDEIQVTTPRGEFLYDVRETTIVDPDDVSVLNPTERPTLTLITCYPFSYVGHAPRRFIVHAERRP